MKHFRLLLPRCSCFFGLVALCSFSAFANPDLKVGVWTRISPPQVEMTKDNHVFTQGLAVDPKDPSTIYLCINAYDVSKAGLWKTTDGGSTWKKAGKLDEPVHIAIDPKDSTHLYCVDGVRGATQGFWESRDAGETWTQPEGFQQITQKPVGTRDLYSIATDPADFGHILVTFHSPWAGTKNAGILESKDGGAHWSIIQPPEGSERGYGMAVFFLFDPASKTGDANTWLFTAQHGGFFRTTDAGKTWTLVHKFQMTHGGNQLYRAKDGTLYSGGYQYLSRSTDNGASWMQIKKGLPYSWYTGVCGDGRNIYTGGVGKNDPFFTSPETDGQTWSKFGDGKQTFSNMPFEMAYDSKNHIMYSASWEEGLLALKTEE